MSRLLPNLPIEDLTPENDYLGVIEKGDMIKNFLLLNTEEFSEIKMFALYGEWGSGKSTLMKYLQKELQDSCNTHFFEAWEFESDSNLPISLLEDLMDKSESISEKRSGEILQIAEDLFVGFAKSLRIYIPGLSINGKEVIQALEKKPASFLKLKKKFKKEFQKWENTVIKDDPSIFNLIFIDDLDRCEPENVLNLLSALKLFFTYGSKTIFFCGVDKKAIYEAISTKYGDVVKSEEYLEKVFDLSFSMPKKQRLDLLVNQYFSNEQVYKFSGNDRTEAEIISGLLYSLDFRNARRVKKVLNKYSLLKLVVGSLSENHFQKSQVPKIFNEELKVLFDLIFCIYFIILKEFYPKIFNEVSEKNLRLVNYAAALKKSPKAQSNHDFKVSHDYLEKLLNKKRFDISKSDMGAYRKSDSISKQKIKAQIIINFAPTNPNYLLTNAFGGVKEFVDGFKQINESIDYRFTHYLLGNFDDLMYQDLDSSARICDIFSIVDFAI